MEKTLEFGNVARLREFSVEYGELEDLYLYASLRGCPEGLTDLIRSWPLKSAGMMVFLLLGGSPVEVEINLEPHVVEPQSFMAIFPGNVFKFKTLPGQDISARLLYFDVKFLHNINVNLTSIALPPMVKRPAAVQHLDRDECATLLHYFDLFMANTVECANPQINKSITSSLSSAMVYQMVQIYHKRIAGELAASPQNSETGRRHEYVREFMRLVHLHYTRERAVSFYADKLFISPKYLSLLVKETTGRSAAKWIDEFVLMEAKNMLRFSGKNIQQVAYSLNFPTQSSFGKYFKHLTGMSPTEYQKS